MTTRIARITGSAAALAVAIGGITLGTAQAATTASFNAPMFGTTATLTEARMPVYAQVECSDATCASGVLTRAAGGFTQYSSPSISLGGAFSKVPGFLAKLNKSWSSATRANTQNYSSMTINFAQFAPGTDLAAAVATDAADTELTLSAPETVGSTTYWSATRSDEDSEWKVAYIANGDAIARGVCIQDGTERGSVTCNPANVRTLAQGIIDTPAAATLAESGSIAGLIPATPRGLSPVLLNIEPALPLWAGNAPGAALDRSLAARKNSVALQYSVKGNPALIVTTKVAALSSTAPALPFVKTICESNSVTKRSCTLSRVPGKAYGFIGDWSRAGKPDETENLSMHFTGAKKLGDARCGFLGDVKRGLTTKELATCRTALVTFANSVVK
ncbi:MAG: hypothetical protein ACR2JS_02505 [Candidatus Nanopelagicales bacterium]